MQLIWDTVQWRALTNIVMKARVVYNTGDVWIVTAASGPASRISWLETNHL
jgi:hypothetical protein